jgi:hypothetical protein
MGCGSSKNAVRVTEPGGAKAAQTPHDTAGVEKPPREKSQIPPLKIWVSYEDTGRRTGIMLTGWDQEDATTVEDMARVLVSEHAPRLQQLGFSGVALVLLDQDGAVRPPRQKISQDELLACTDMKNPLRVSSPPQWCREAVLNSQDANAQTAPSPVQGTMLCSAATASTASRGSAERAMLSPRSRAYRADIDAIVKQKSPQSKTTVYTPDQVFPDLIKRDIHSHLAKEINEEPAQAAAHTAEELRAFEKPGKVASQRSAAHRLDAARMQELTMQLAGFASKYRDKDRKTLLKDLKSMLEPESWEQLQREAQTNNGAWSGQVSPAVGAWGWESRVGAFGCRV